MNILELLLIFKIKDFKSTVHMVEPEPMYRDKTPEIVVSCPNFLMYVFIDKIEICLSVGSWDDILSQMFLNMLRSQPIEIINDYIVIYNNLFEVRQ